MKKIIVISLFFLFFLSFAGYSQEIKYIPDTVVIKTTDSLGLLQWQVSLDQKEWYNIEGETKSQLIYEIVDDTYFRLKVTEGECKWYTEVKNISYDIEKKIYGVRINKNKIFDNLIERICDSKDKATNIEIEGVKDVTKDDFLHIYPFDSFKICNIVNSTTGERKIIYQNEENFSRKYDTFVEIPFFYMNRFIKDNFEYRLISKTKHEGFYPAPMFVEGNTILDKVYIAVYETSLGENGLPESATNKIPLTEKTMSQYRELYNKKGVGYSSIDIRTVMSIQHLYLIRYANKNSQESIGGGWCNLRQPILPIINNGPSNSITILENAKNADLFWFVNQDVCTLTENKWTVSEYAKIIDFKKNTPSVGYTTFILDKELNFNSNMFFGSSAQRSGWSDKLTYFTGRTKPNTLNDDNQSCSVKLFGMENLWGNVWEFVDGIYFSGLTPHISFNAQKNGVYSDYIPIDFLCKEQNNNDPWNATFGFITNLGVDKKFSWFGYAETFGEIGVNGRKGYGDFYYKNNDLKNSSYTVFGGGFDHFDRAGLFNLRNWIYSSNTWYLYGSRMQYKPVTK